MSRPQPAKLLYLRGTPEAGAELVAVLEDGASFVRPLTLEELLDLQAQGAQLARMLAAREAA